MNRLLYYCALVFSLFSRTHLWLVAGALVAALTYAGVAAVHACLLVWRGPNPSVEYDTWALLTILSSACLITVPLLNWSGTLRHLGEKFKATKKDEGEDTQSDVGTRTIVIYWAFLVLVGFISMWVFLYQLLYGDGGTYDTNDPFPDMNKVICRAGTDAIIKQPYDGTLIPIDQSFIIEHGCNNPCDQLNVTAIFRQKSELQLLSRSQLDIGTGEIHSKKEEHARQAYEQYGDVLHANLAVLPFILLQGFIAALFGYRDPREIRDSIYIKLSKGFSPVKPSVRWFLQHWAARILAFLSYVIAALTVIICPPFFVAQIVMFERTAWGAFSDAEPPGSIGQWQPWLVALQAILAALIARYNDSTVGELKTFYQWTFNKCFRRHPYNSLGTEGNADHISLSTMMDTETHLRKDHWKTSLRVIPPSPYSLSARLQQPYSRFRNSSLNVYRIHADPLKPSYKRLQGEMGNFFSWCKDPEKTSKLVDRARVETEGTDSGFFRTATSASAKGSQV